MTDVAATKQKSVNYSLEFDGTATPTKTALFLLLVVCWLLPGLIGHDPWKPQEAQTFGVTFDMLKSGQWLVPMLAGEPYLDRPPLYYWTAALFAKAFSSMLPLHDAARLASGFYMLLAILFITLTAAKLFGPRFGRVTALLFIGSFGLLITAHTMLADSAGLAGAALALYGLAWLPGRVKVAGLCAGSGIGVAFLSKGVMAAVLVFSMALAPWVLFRVWRTRAYGQALGVAVLAALPWLLLWPIALYLRSPQFAAEWLWLNELNDFSNLFSVETLRRAGYYTSLLPWHAWPALPLVLVAFWYGRKTLASNEKIQLLLGAFFGLFAALCLLGEMREVNALPLLLPLSLLCSSQIDTLRRGATSALDWFGMMGFGLLAGAMWLGWLALLYGVPKPLANYLQIYLPGHRHEFELIPFTLAIALSMLWLIAITRLRRSNRRAVVNWTAGITMFWMLAMTLWLPFFDEAKSYRATIAALQRALPATANCVASRQLGESQRALLDYFAGLRTQRLELSATNICNYLLIQGTRQSPSDAEPADWKLLWQGARPGDNTELYRLYERKRKNKRKS